MRGATERDTHERSKYSDTSESRYCAERPQMRSSTQSLTTTYACVTPRRPRQRFPLRRPSVAPQAALLAGVFLCALGMLTPAVGRADVGTIDTFAGSPIEGPVTATSIGAIGSAATETIDGTTYAYIADGAENVVRRVDLATGQAQVIAGNGGDAAPLAGTAATSTPTGDPEEITVDTAGDIAFRTVGKTVFVPATSGSYFNQSMTAGDLYLLPLTSETISLEPGGSLVWDYDGVIKVDSISTGASSMLASGSINNLSIASDPNHAGNFAFVVGETGPAKAGHEIDYYAFQAGTFFGHAMSAGINPIADTANEGGFGVDTGDDGPATSALENPPSTGYQSLAFDAGGDLLLLDDGQDGIHDGQQRLIAATNCASACPYGLPATNAGYIYFTELPPYDIAIAGNDEVLADEQLTGTVLYSPSATDEGAIAGDGTYGYDGDGSPGASSELGSVSWTASDAAGDVAIVDSADSRVRFMPTSSGSYYGQQMTAGDLYTIAGNGIPSPLSGSGGYGGDEGPATAAAARFSTFQFGAGVALDAAGDLAIADPGNSRVRFVPARTGTFYGHAMTAGYVYTIATGLSDAFDVTFNAAGDVVVADGPEIKEIASETGAVSSLATVTQASAVAVDAQGDIAYSDGNDSVFLIPATSGTFFGQALTAHTPALVAGGTKGYTGDGGAATSAALDEPEGLVFDRFGDLVIAQQGEQIGSSLINPAVRLLPASTGSFYGQPMTLGDIYTIAGRSTGGFSGDGGPGTDAELSHATSVAMMPGDDVLIADEFNNRVRILAGSVPTATTGSPGTPTAESDTVSGSVDPQGRPVSYHFDYGTSTAYGSSAPISDQSVGSDHAEHAESQTLAGLAPDTTYHYRIVADYEEAGAILSVFGADATFTTAAAPVTSPTGSSASTGSSAGTTQTSASTTGASTTSTAGAAGTATALEATRALACTTAQVALIDVATQGSHVLITGAARQVLVGRRVTIKLLSTGRTVASPTVSAAGTFSATVPLPPAKGRGSNRTRYQASVGTLRSLALKLERRADFLHVSTSGGHVSIAGHVTGSFKAGTLVHITLRVTCAKYKTVDTVKLGRSGTFRALVPAPSGASSQIAVYRAATTVLDDGHPEPTFTLPTPPS